MNASDCHACLDGSTQDMTRLWHFIKSFFGAVGASMVVSLVNSQNATLQEQFTARLCALMGKVTERVAYASSRMFAVSSATVTPFVNTYDMAQCTRDLVDDNCNH
ncbi:uncharacterized protein [Miscanthus floridulus]|uniref:uncharacterized protein n=1 Tax=Miscanthus floridulus TaxID=154761 RepID=UPI003458A114